MSWYDEMLRAMSEYASQMLNEKVNVVRYEDRTEYGGYCNTCSYSYMVVDLYDENGTKVFTHEGSISDLMERLTN